MVKLRMEMASIHLTAAANCLRFPRGRTEELPKMDQI